MFCFLDVDIADARASYKRACEFVEANSIKYGLSSNVLSELGGREKLGVPELYANDYAWKERGGCQVDPQPCCRMVFELFAEESPLAVENFHTLCIGSKGKSKTSGAVLSYQDSKIHRYVPGFILQGGDITFGNGSGGESIWGKKFKDDVKGLKLKHDARGILSMGNSGKNSNSSQFFVTLAAAPACDKKHVVFGRLASGHEVLDLIDSTLAAEAVSSSACASSEAPADSEVPRVPIVITACGVWNDTNLAQGYWGADDVFTSFS